MQGREMRIERVPAVPKKPEMVRVAAYARVSADKDAAFHSLGSQTDYYEKYVAAHPEWILAEIYSDNAISGTVIERPEFQRMLRDCRAGKIDPIITKSITRFARNTVALLETIRELKRLQIDVYFEKGNIHTFDPKCEVLLTIMSSLAQEESRSISENVRWDKEKSMRNGLVYMPYGHFMGYRKGEDGRPSHFTIIGG
ncbi:MAG: recombinase family protein [Candidatus Saccharibacteria bacterium]|nr:recombinase family protein [Candidatus Saccharibacteria bacterium]